MSQAGVVTRLAVRELWITFRLVFLLVAFVGVGAAVALLPAPLPTTMQRFAAGLGAAMLLVVSVAAWSIADERRHGRAGWLITRSVARGTFLVGWFVAISSVALAGLAAAALLGWLAASSVSLRLDPGIYAVLIGATAATLVASVALGLLAGTILGPRSAVLLGILVGTLLVAAAAALPRTDGLVPGAALLELAALKEGPVSLATTWRSAGAALVAAGVLLGVARLALSRAEL